MIRSIHRALDVAVLSFAVPLTVVMLACTVWQVVSRYFLGISTSFTDELARYLFIWVSLLGAAYMFGRRGHIAITGLINMTPPGARRVIDITIAFLVIVFSVVILGIGGWILVERAVSFGQVSAAMQLPVGWVYAVIPLSGAITTVYAVLMIVELATGQLGDATDVSLD